MDADGKAKLGKALGDELALLAYDVLARQARETLEDSIARARQRVRELERELARRA